MTELSRVKKVCKWLIFNEVADNDKELSDILGYTKSSFSQIINGKVPLSDKFIDKLIGLDQNINKVWIKTGEGQMLHQEEKNKVLSMTPHASDNSLPLIPVEAFAGAALNNGYAVDFEAIEERYNIPLFEGKGVDFLMYVRGSSMYPKYRSGDIVACRFVRELLFIQWNKVYIIDSKSQGAMIKRLLPSKNPDHVICRSDNKEYIDFEVPLSDIQNIAMVIGCISLE
ncbi:LexA family transcriptional regulator [Sphingobacterium siyangense]|uniref:Phage repressor protein C with HTH and peptisase S24 domain n=1 Tax=Sphingobacterium siyangense TaxID=459529 RepID=A0A562MQM4_9SPHI|nr:S24 family peptidase [Sphingobacterium siyangense]TWI22159.1 phage repressor protein C with HTH and peptisase S24 domain [Sphingobacterium siyangense]